MTGIRSWFGLFPDGSGKKVRTSQITDENGATVYIQAGSVADPDSVSIANVKPGGTLPAASTDNALVVTVRDAVSVSDAQSAPFAGAVAMTVDTTYTAQRSVGVLATAAGNVMFTFPDASTLTLPVYVGWQTFPFACVSVVSSGTTATATYYGLK